MNYKRQLSTMVNRLYDYMDKEQHYQLDRIKSYFNDLIGVAIKDVDELEAASAPGDRPEIFDYYENDGTKHRLIISPANQGIIHYLRTLPPSARARLLALDVNELQEAIDIRIGHLYDKLLHLLNQKWKDKYEGERYNFKDAEMNKVVLGIALTKTQIVRQVRSKKLPLNDCQLVIKNLESDEELIRVN